LKIGEYAICIIGLGGMDTPAYMYTVQAASIKVLLYTVLCH